MPSSGVYRDLEQYFGTDFTEAILQQDTDPCPLSRDIKDEITTRDRDLLLTGGLTYMYIMVEVEREIGWPLLYGTSHADARQWCQMY